MAKISETGQWSVGNEPGHGETSIFLQSEDFTHDARLYIDGAFKSEAEKLDYAAEIARRLNAWRG